MYYGTSASGTVFTTITTNENGVGTATLGIGTYTIKEKTAPTGYALDTKTYTAVSYTHLDVYKRQSQRRDQRTL